ncbi:MAG: sulfatase [Planctomycetota bacterium]|nr:sulfatase [Planctomycetota bacterium]
MGRIVTMTRKVHHVVFVLLVTLIACGGEGDSKTASGPVNSLIVVTLDTTRADHISSYGYPLPTTPVLDALADEGLRFERTYAPMGQTLPSHATLFSGQHPREHGMLENHGTVSPEVETLAEILAEEGFDTAAFTSARVLSRAAGLDQGFHHYDESPPTGENYRHTDRSAEMVTDACLSWLGERDSDRPLFLWVHYFDPHFPFNAPGDVKAGLDVAPIEKLLKNKAKNSVAAGQEPGFTNLKTTARYWRDYDAEIRFMDQHMGRLLKGLEEQGILPGATVLVVGDHGEGLYDHGERNHGINLYDELLRVPMVLVPSLQSQEASESFPGQVLKEAVALEDVRGALLRLSLGESGAGKGRGSNLWDEIVRQGAPRPRPIFVERPHYSAEQLTKRSGKKTPDRYVFGAMMAVIAEGFKYILGPDGTEELYDLSADPDELHNLSGEDEERRARLAGLMAAWMEAHPVEVVAPGDDLDQKRLEELRQLGYGR